MTLRNHRVDILTKDVGILAPETTGLGEAIQAARVVVTYAGESRSHVVVRRASLPFVLVSSDEDVRRLFPADVASLVRFDAEGETTISCSAVDEVERFAAAAAVATLKRSWGWDESPTVKVTFHSDGRELCLNPSFEDGAWSVRDPATTD
jgi:hypothetical protein